MINQAPSVGEAELEEAEIVMGLPLPNDLRSFYLNTNGGRPVPSVFVRDGREYCVHRFFPVKHGRKGEFLEDAVRMSRDYLPPTALPIAIDAGGDLFFYSLAQDTSGSIWFYRSDYFDDPDRALVKLADNLVEFLGGLVDQP